MLREWSDLGYLEGHQNYSVKEIGMLQPSSDNR
jgi:hypothetical protein